MGCRPHGPHIREESRTVIEHVLAHSFGMTGAGVCRRASGRYGGAMGAVSFPPAHVPNLSVRAPIPRPNRSRIDAGMFCVPLFPPDLCQLQFGLPV